MEKLLSVTLTSIALAFALSLAACNQPASAPPAPPPVVEAPRAETPTPPPAAASPETVMGTAKKKAGKTYTQTPRLDDLTRRVTALENKVKFYEQQFLR